jgi:hypothetical protein
MYIYVYIYIYIYKYIHTYIHTHTHVYMYVYRESLLVPGTKLLVLSRSRKGRVCEIRCKEVGNAIHDV